MSNTAEVLARVRADKYLTEATYRQLVREHRATLPVAKPRTWKDGNGPTHIALALMVALVSSPFIIHLLRVV